jgi:lysophospholipase L1-like esterase
MPDLPTDTSDVPDVPAPEARRRFRARDVILCVGVAALLLVLFEGHSIRHAGEELKPGWQRTLVLAVGKPAGWVSDELYLADAKQKLTSWLRPDGGSGAGGAGSFAAVASTAGAGTVTPDAFGEAAFADGARKARPLRTVLVTGDSLSQPLDAELARDLARSRPGVKTVRDAHLGTGISQSDIVDWGSLSVEQTKGKRPDAVVMFMGANEGFPMTVAGKAVECCSARWAAEYANRVRRMMDTYRQAGVARVYWLNLPAPRDRDRQEISDAVNAAIVAAAAPYRAQVRILDMNALFTPGNRYRDAMPVGGRDQIVRESDGIHLNQTGAEVAATTVAAALARDYPAGGTG